jgi:cytochrome P450
MGTVLASAANFQKKSWPEVHGHWLGGCLRQIQREPLDLYRNAWREHGDFIKFRAIPGFYMYLLAHPAAIEYVLQGNMKNYRKPDSFNQSVKLLAGQGILTSEGELWRHQRRIMQPAFARHAVSSLTGHITSAVAKFVDEWNRQADGRSVDVLEETMRLGLRIASLALMGTDISGNADAIGHAYRITFEYVSQKMNGAMMFSPLWMPTARNRKFRAAKALLDRVVMDLIARRRTEPSSGDVLGRLVQATDEETGDGMSDEQLRDEVLTLLTAGHETGGAALSWSLYLLAEHPQIQEQLHEEVRAVLSCRPAEANDLARLPLATAVFEEAMRLYPPAWGMPRETIEDDEICGHPVPAKSTLMISQLLAHRHPEFWSDPERFDPARFLGAAARERAKYAYFPFGGGQRVCIGNHMAMLQGPLSLATLVDQFHFKLVEGQHVVPDPTFTLRPKGGLRMIVRRRS